MYIATIDMEPGAKYADPLTNMDWAPITESQSWAPGSHEYLKAQDENAYYAMEQGQDQDQVPTQAVLQHEQQRQDKPSSGMYMWAPSSFDFDPVQSYLSNLTIWQIRSPSNISRVANIIIESLGSR